MTKKTEKSTVDWDKFEEQLPELLLKGLSNVLGIRDARTKHIHLTNPENKKTMSRLTNPQIKGMKLAYAFQESYGIGTFHMMYDHLADSMISHKGKGREEVIKSEQARKPSEIPFGIMTSGPPAKQEVKKKRFWQKPKKEEE